MPTTIFSKFCVLCCGLALLTVPASAGASMSSEEPVTLKVQVSIPPSWNLAPGEPLPDFIAASLSDALRRAGLMWPIAPLRSVEDAAKVPYLLKVDVTEWGRTADGDFNCTFAATVRTPSGERRVGVYSNTTWAPGVIYSNSQSAYFPTRLDPIRALRQDLENCELLSKSAA